MPSRLVKQIVVCARGVWASAIPNLGCCCKARSKMPLPFDFPALANPKIESFSRGFRLPLLTQKFTVDNFVAAIVAPDRLRARYRLAVEHHEVPPSDTFAQLSTPEFIPPDEGREWCIRHKARTRLSGYHGPYDRLAAET
jgi:hypothetical protein